MFCELYLISNENIQFLTIFLLTHDLFFIKMELAIGWKCEFIWFWGNFVSQILTSI